MTSLSPEAHWLLQRARRLARSDAHDRLAPWPADWQQLHTLARYHEVHPWLYRIALSAPPGTVLPTERTAIERWWQFTTARAFWQWEMLRACVRALEAEGIAVIPLKGVVLGALVYGEPALRPPGVDIDLLVPQRQWLAAAAMLERLGYRRISAVVPSGAFLRHYKSAEFVRPGACVELHWTFVTPRPNPIDPAFAWQHAVRRRVDDEELLTLSWEDLLLTLAMHLRRHLQSLRLKHLLDIALLLRHHAAEMDWTYVWEAARRLRIYRTLAYVLFLTRRVLEVSLPAAATGPLRSLGWRGACWSRWAGFELRWRFAAERRAMRWHDGMISLWKCLLMDSGFDMVRAGVKRAWWAWDERRLRPYRSVAAPHPPSPHDGAPGEQRQANKVPSPESPRMAAQPVEPLAP